jgi:hypothetical protein
MSNFIDLIDDSHPWGGTFSDDEDELAFGSDDEDKLLYKHNIWWLKHNDPYFSTLNISCSISERMAMRIGIYLWQNKYVKNLKLSYCLDDDKMHHLFGKIALQNITNAYILEVDILGKLMANEQSLVRYVLEGVTSFTQLVKVDISSNHFGMSGLDVLVRSLAGSPIEELNISWCGLDGISPLTGTRLCPRLDELDISGNTLRLDDANTVSMLLDNGYPNLRQLNLKVCGITDEFVEAMSPALSKNKSLRYLNLFNFTQGEIGLGSNVIGPRGLTAISKAICDCSSFKSILASNHTVKKITMDGMDSLWWIIKHNGVFWDVHPKRAAWFKYIECYVKTEGSVDMSPFMDVSINLLPILLSKLGWDKYDNECIALNACYKLWSCKMFRERISMASQVKHLQAANDQLLDENNALKEQIAKLFAANGKPKSTKNANLTYVSTSIGERVKERNANRKRGRNVSC